MTGAAGAAASSDDAAKSASPAEDQRPRRENQRHQDDKPWIDGKGGADHACLLASYGLLARVSHTSLIQAGFIREIMAGLGKHAQRD